MIRTDPDWITDVLRSLVRINSTNPSLDPHGAGEAEIGAYVAETLSRLGLEVSRHEPSPGRVSVVGRLRGQGSGRSLMLNAHYDTVGVEGMQSPFAADVRDGRLYGRGAYDMKGSLAACMGAVEALLRAGTRPAGDVLIAAVADEEHSSLGTRDLVGRYRVDGAIVTEPTSLRVCLAHKGFVWMEVTTQGRAAHGSRPDLGIDANTRMGRVLVRLEGLGRELRARTAHPLLGHASLHAALLQGGTGLSTYAAECRLGLERRTIPPEREAEVVQQVQSILDALHMEDDTFHATLATLLAQPPFEARPGSPLVSAVASQVESELGHAPEFVGETPWMDSALLAAAGVDTVVLGPHGEGAHADCRMGGPRVRASSGAHPGGHGGRLLHLSQPDIFSRRRAACILSLPLSGDPLETDMGAMQGQERVTELLLNCRGGDRDAFDRLFPLVYQDLRGMALRQLRREPDGHTLGATALVHEAYVRLVDINRVEWRDRAHFLAMASRAMRRILVDYARKHRAARRGGGAVPVELDDAMFAIESDPDRLIDLDAALDGLARMNERLARVVECRFFGGLTDAETALALGVTERTVQRDWLKARGWLFEALGSPG